MRFAALLLAILMLTSASAGFGAGRIEYDTSTIPGEMSAPEPTIGVNWNTDTVFYHAGSTTFTVRYNDEGEATWTDVTPPYQVPINLDPMLHTDELTGRTFAGGLLGPCSVMFYTDDDGATWLPSLNMCSGAQFDHQSIGTGPKPVIGNPAELPQLQNAYYCGQLVLIGCSVSLDGGVTWTAPTPAVIGFVQGGCGGFHGHWRTSLITGSAFLPVASCGDGTGMLVANLGVGGTEAAGLTGLTFEPRIVPGSQPWVGGFDPSIGIGKDAGWLYFGQADVYGANIGLSKDEGLTWETIGGGMGVEPTTFLDVGQFHDPPIVAATFADVQAGDDDRVAYSFIGLEDLDGDGLGEEYESLYDCDVENENRVWRYYVANSYDAGETWIVNRISDDVIQIGGIWDGGGGNPCRNLLDFNDMDIDSQGRVYIGYADGCLDECEAKLSSGENLTAGPYSQVGELFRQVGGFGLFSEFDQALDLDGDGEVDTPPTGEAAINYGRSAPGSAEPEDKESSFATLVALVALLGAIVIARRK